MRDNHIQYTAINHELETEYIVENGKLSGHRIACIYDESIVSEEQARVRAEEELRNYSVPSVKQIKGMDGSMTTQVLVPAFTRVTVLGRRL